jgi:hypothetical protein
VRQFVQDSQEFTERLDEAITKVSSHPFEKGFIQLAGEVMAQFPKEMGFKPLTQVERPVLSAQTIFFRLSQLTQQGARDGFKEENKG